MCDFGNEGGVVSEWNIASDCIPELNGQDGVQVLAACDYGDGVFYNVVYYWRTRGFDDWVKLWMPIPEPIEY